MKKIGILTFYKAQNYGAVLQAYALQEKINDLGFDAYHINFQDKLYMNNNSSLVRKIFSVIKLSKGNVYKYIKTKNISSKTSNLFEKFRKNNIHESKKKYNKNDISCSNLEYDAFVCGSDMVWSDIGQDLETYFLRFTDYEKRIAYAPSITGTDNYSIEKNEMMKEYINGIKHLSVREKSGIDYINKITARKAFLAIDPTLLLTKDDWIDKLYLQKNTDDKYVLVYMFQGSKSISKEIKTFAKKNNLKIRYIPMTIDERYNEVKNGFSGSYGPKEFLELFLNASFVVTNSYHGLIFSINFNIPFVLYHRETDNKWKDHENRMNGILDMFNLNERYLYYNNHIKNNFINLNYDSINDKLHSLTNESLKYLKNSLNSVDKKKIN
ncbi:polysaccharide pyruvyl transferase family protein [Kandleria vitulina]|uniref:polysaccharide pyruvyl transferase family protein n=1 Tax=Kandleria vitulina TaxID=1630 RepID=UPI000490F929|nr:polysaccharide pyruvyl transferase family protein [Kandleria vitulina]